MSVRTTAARAGDHPVLQRGAKVGYAATGVLHLLIAWVVVQLVVGSGTEQADERGALRTLAETGPGAVLLWVLAVAFAAIALWHVTEVVARDETGRRLKAAGKSVVYAGLAVLAVGVIAGEEPDDDAGSMTARFLAEPWGAVAVGAAGVAVLGVGLYHVYKGLTDGFRDDLVTEPARWVVVAGRVGYVARGVALGLVGGFLVAAALGTGEQSQGLDAVLRSLADLTVGPALLLATAAGFAAFGGYSLARGRYARV